MDKFLEVYNLPRPNQGEIENMDRQIICTEMETVILKLPANQGPGLDDFTGKFYQTFREESNACPSETLSKSCRGTNPPKLIL